MSFYTVVQDGSNIEIHLDNVKQTTLDPEAAAELAALLTRAVELYWDQYNDDRADAAAEQDAYERSLEQLETQAELAYDKAGYNDIPF